MTFNLYYSNKDKKLLEQLQKEAKKKDWSLSKYIIWILGNR